MENERKERKDLIRRGDAIDLCEMAIDDSWEYDYATDRMFEIPAVDAVEVCRCKDCRYGTIDQYSAGEYVVVCNAPKKRPGTDVYALDWYCPMGQRREDGDA